MTTDITKAITDNWKIDLDDPEPSLASLRKTLSDLYTLDSLLKDIAEKGERPLSFKPLYGKSLLERLAEYVEIELPLDPWAMTKEIVDA